MGVSTPLKAVETITLSEKPLISRQILFGNPDKAGVQLSPDGRWISYIAPLEGVLNIWVAPRGHLDKAEPVTRDTGRGIRSYNWAYTNQHILYIQDQDGDENWAVYQVDIETGNRLALTPEKGVHASISKMSPVRPHEVVLSINDRVPELHDLYLVDLVSGSKTLLMENEGFAGFVVDDIFDVRFAFRSTPDGGGHYLKYEHDKWAPFLEISPEDVLTTSLLGFNKEKDALYITDSRDRNTSALMIMDMVSRETKLLSDNKLADINDIIFHPTDKTVLAAAANYDRKQWHFLSDEVEKDFDLLATLQDGDVEVISQTQDNLNWIVAFLRDDGPVAYYDYDRSIKKATFLFTNRQALEGVPLQKMHPVLIKSRDNMTLVSYLTLPRHVDQGQTGKPTEPVPLILDVHGGPRARDSWGYNPLHQWLSDRGYAVLSVNYRSSTGFGKNFINAGNGEWARKMHDDLLDAKDWAVSRGITTEEAVCIFGGSYGGYATLVGLAMTPDSFACGIDIVGPSNLLTLIHSIPPYWKPVLDIMKVMLGVDPETEEGQQILKERSPLTYHENIKKPLLIGQGANDPRVKQAESDQIVAALKSRNIPVTYAFYPNEGHGFARPENRLSFYAVMEAFLAQHLGGHFEPVGEDLEGVSLELREGSELIKNIASPSALQRSTLSCSG